MLDEVQVVLISVISGLVYACGAPALFCEKVAVGKGSERRHTTKCY